MSQSIDMHIPSIVVTPALPSRNSLSSEMRATLDSIIGPALSRSPTPYTDAVDWTAYGFAADDQAKSEEKEVPYIPSCTHPATAVKPVLLQLDLKDVRFSVGEVVSALEAKFRSLTSRDFASDPDSPAADDSNESPTSTLCGPSPAGSDSGSECAFLEENEAYDKAQGDEEEDAEDEGDAFPTVHVVRRPPPPPSFRRANPTWRHAMYVSAMVWPAEHKDSDSRAESQLDTASTLKLQLSRLMTLARCFARQKQ
ncbi:hypothetical protein BV20DRAFT_981776 [Pilatotrama ljubarskyi]|nr:hypothetical protein BV20DRAFT_981776 [Pilatotrama ljubarskyi]